MIPEFFRVGPVAIHSFGFMLAVAFLLIAWLAAREFPRRGFHADAAGTATLAAMVGGVLGAKLYYLVDHWSDTLADPIGTIFSGAGLTFYGGLLGGAVAVLLVARHYRIPTAAMVDMGAPLVALGYGVGRIGCFLNGDDYGRPTALPWGIAFPKGTPPTTPERIEEYFGFTVPPELVERFGSNIPVHPTQLYEAAAGLAFFALLWARRRSWESRPGLAFGLFLLLAGAERFFVEFLRLNTRVALALTVPQFISLGLFAAGLVLIARSRRG